MDQSDRLAEYTNFNDGTVTLASPGSSILSTVTPETGTYLPLATPDSNIVFEDFEDDEPVLAIQQIDKDGNLVGSPAARATSSHLSGSYGVSVPIDQSYDTTEGEGILERPAKTICIDVDLDAVRGRTGVDVAQSLAAAENLYLVLGVAVPSAAANVSIINVQTNATGEAKLVPDDREGYVIGLQSSLCVSLTGSGVTVDSSHLEGHLVIDIKLAVKDTLDSLSIDTVGIGTQRVPYAYMQGTSMACPSITGATAVLAEQFNLEGVELADLVRSKVRVPASGLLNVKLGGVFDFNVQGSTGGEELAPTIADLEVAGTTVTLTGSNFGDRPGVARIGRSFIGKEEAEVRATVTSWSDSRVTLMLEAPFTGIMHATLANAAGKQDSTYLFASKGETAFEQDLPYDASVGEIYRMDGTGDWETKGPLVGLGCKLYHLPASQPTEVVPAYRHFRCFDLKTQTWADLPNLPEYLQNVSAVMYEGKIVVEGATLQILPSGEPTNEFIGEGAAPEERVYVYDPSSAAWTRASSQGMHDGQTLVNDAGQLRLAGGTGPVSEGASESAPLPYMGYDLHTGAGDAIYRLTVSTSNPSAVVKDGTCYLYDRVSQQVVRANAAGCEQLENALPPSVLPGDPLAVIFAQNPNDPTVTWGTLAVASEGIVFVGPSAADGSSDTYLLRDGANAFEPYARRVSDARILSSTACTYRGRLFVIASSWIEPNQRIFRATPMGVPEYAGDDPCETTPGPKPTPEPVTPAPAKGVTSNVKTSAARLAKTGDESYQGFARLTAGIGVSALAIACALRRRRVIRH